MAKHSQREKESTAPFRTTRIQNFNLIQMLRNYGCTESEFEVETQFPFTSILEALPSPTSAVSPGVFALEPDDQPTSLAEVRKSFEKALAPPSPVLPLPVCVPSKRASQVLMIQGMSTLFPVTQARSN